MRPDASAILDITVAAVAAADAREKQDKEETRRGAGGGGGRGKGTEMVARHQFRELVILVACVCVCVCSLQHQAAQASESCGAAYAVPRATRALLALLFVAVLLFRATTYMLCILAAIPPLLTRSLHSSLIHFQSR